MAVNPVPEPEAPPGCAFPITAVGGGHSLPCPDGVPVNGKSAVLKGTFQGQDVPFLLRVQFCTEGKNAVGDFCPLP